MPLLVPYDSFSPVRAPSLAFDAGWVTSALDETDPANEVPQPEG